MQNDFTMPILNQNRIPRIAAIHDICGYGNCSLAVAMPVISMAGVDVLPAPTAVVSAQTNLPYFTIMDTTSILQEYFNSWKKLEITVDGIYTGFLGSEEQIHLIEEYCKQEKDAFVVIDPVMGDHGKAYPTYTQAMCDEMKKLVPYADVLTPNITEASIILGVDYPGQQLQDEVAEEMLDGLLELGAKSVVLKGIRHGDEVYNIIKGIGTEAVKIPNKWHEVSLHGTGDLFASCLTAGLFSEHTLEKSVEFAGNLVYKAIDFSTTQPGHLERGVNFEPLLVEIGEFCKNK